MLSPGRIRRSVRTVFAVGAATCAVVGLSGCDKPNPVATLTVGSDSAHSHDTCDNDGKKLGEKQLQQCAKEAKSKSISFTPSDTLRFGVDPEVAEKGWEVITTITDPQSSQQQSVYLVEYTKETYATTQDLQLGRLADKSEVAVVERNKDGDAYRVWNFTLDKKDH